MAGVGRPAKPPKLRLIEGRGNGKDSGGRTVKETPGFKRIPPNPPTWLPAEAKAEWRRIVPELARLELIKTIDRAALTAYCLTWQRLYDAHQLAMGRRTLEVRTIRDGAEEIDYIDGKGLLALNSQGITRAPWIAIIEAASKELRAWAAEFGLTPGAENKLSVREAGDGEEDIFGG